MTPRDAQQPATFGDIRGVVQRPPSEEAWFALCELFERWPHPERLDAEVIPYVAAHLGGWPDRYRVVPDRWLNDWMTEDLGALSKLMRRLFLGSKLRESPSLMRVLGVEANRHLTQIDLGWNALGPRHFRILGNTDNLTGLTHLGLRGNRPGDPGLLSLCAASMLPNLRWLDVGYCGISYDGLVALASAALKQLDYLDISRNEIGPRGVTALRDASFGRSIGSLVLSGGRLGDVGVERLVASASCFPNLRHLYLNDNNIGRDGARALATSAILEQLETLSLNGNNIGDDGVCALVNSPKIQGVLHLSLMNINITQQVGTPIGDTAIAAIATSPYLTGLRSLELSRVSEKGRELLICSTTLPQKLRSRWR